MVNVITVIIAIIITLNNMLSFCLFLDYLNVLYFKKYTQIYSYKITNLFYTISIVLSYIGITIIFVYFIRLLSLGYLLDLKVLYFKLCLFFSMYIKPLDFTSKIYLFGFCCILALGALLMFNLYHKYVKKEMMKIYIYIDGYRYYCFENESALGKRLSEIFSKIKSGCLKRYPDIFSAFIYKSKIPKIFSQYFYGDPYRIRRHHLAMFIQISPLFVILYDCIFNNFVITHFYYYMVIFFPVMVLKRLDKLLNTLIYSGVLWCIYYDPEKNHKFVVAVTTLQKEFLDLIIKRGEIPTEFILDSNDVNALWELKYILQDPEKHIYVNMFGNYLRVDIENNKIYEITEDDNGNNIYTESFDYNLL